MLCVQTGCIAISFPKHTKKALIDCKGDCKGVKVLSPVD